ncbi:oxygen-independent coproporphyrinogen III oxidase [Polymorphobacter multimanifer]|uniref:Coproporphyrinogen-III oxidase n=1 Tax=Polymorphobacter multimanifer TaxID=1070431 RepID=A0A841L2W9_9SPHN|nr:oxygen-independent coproporphyrinogen III oxidase [Polymorphobacter multimanifer]MBB6227179.1 oxygen-independent coproporphyrinogen-3 oxidase [Polymorphobacter multimanifer]GGI72302.1 oxygen-independent coproporphyrinogen III oxidase [Polymorphobacter multimanifer]
MSIYFPELLATPVPRYTSYPTAAEFHQGIGAQDMAAAIDAVAPGTPVSLYLHIPFCHQLCWYCGCNTGTTGRGDRLRAYLDRLKAEVALVAARLGQRGRITRIAFGGGSPNAVAAADFAALLGHVRQHFAADSAIVSVEIDPRGLDAGWAAMLKAEGVTRASLGVQTLDPAIQAAIGRIQPLTVIEKSVALLRGAGITSLNFDLMYGLPGQQPEHLAGTLASSIALAPDRLAVFGYAHVPHLIARQRRIDDTALPDAPARFAMAEFATRMLTAAGYQPIGFDHFARPDDPLALAAREDRLHRNFQGFTDDDAKVTLGMGVSAISVFPDLLVQNEKHSGRYHAAIGSQRLAAALGCRRSEEDRVRAGIICSILGTGAAYAGRLACQPQVRDRLAPFEAAGLLHWRGSRLELAADAMPYARTIAAAFDTHRQVSQVQLSRAV